MSLSPIRILTQSDPALLQVLKLIQESYIFMIGRIDPPSSVRSLTLQDLTEKAQTDWILGVGDPVEACVVASPRHNALYLGKMAVHQVCAAKAWRGLWCRLVRGLLWILDWVGLSFKYGSS